MKEREYITIKQLAERLGISEINARYLARSKRLRDIKGAVINVNASGNKNEILRVDFNAAIRVYNAI